MSNQKQSFWRYENGILILLSLTYGLIFLDRFSITNLFPQIAGDLHLNNTQLGLTMSVVAFAWGVSSFVFSYISDILGKKKLMLVVVVFAFSLSTFFSGLAATFIAFLLARALLGIAEGPAVPLVQSTVMAESTESRKGLNTGIPIATSALLSAAAPLLLVWIAQVYGWRISLYAITIPGIIIGFLLMKFMRESKVTNVSDQKKSKMSFADIKMVLRTRNVWISMLVATLNVAGGIATLMTFAPLFLMNVGHLKQTQAAGIMTVYGLVSLIGNLYIPWLSDKIGRKKAFLLGSFMQFLIPMSLIAFHSNYTMLIVSIIVLCGGQATMGLCMFIIPGESVPKRLMTTASSLPNFVGEVIGGSIGGIVAGYLGDKFGLTAAMIFASVVLLGSFILGLAYKESHAKYAKENLMEDRAS